MVGASKNSEFDVDTRIRMYHESLNDPAVKKGFQMSCDMNEERPPTNTDESEIVKKFLAKFEWLLFDTYLFF